MSNLENAEVLFLVREQILKDSTFVGELFPVVLGSLYEKSKLDREQAADYEAALAMIFSGNSDLAKEKIKKWVNKHFCEGWEERVEKQIKIVVKRKK